MQTVMIRGIVVALLYLSGLCAVAHAAEQPITRTVEHFTLGMSQDQAFAVLLAGIKQHHFTLMETAQTPSSDADGALGAPPMDAVGPLWLAPQSADVLYTLNAFLFDAQEFKDPVVNIALSAQVAQSLAWSSPTAQSMSLLLSALPRLRHLCRAPGPLRDHEKRPLHEVRSVAGVDLS